MVVDETEEFRRTMIETGQPMRDLEEVLKNREPCWDTEELKREFTVIGFMAPFVLVVRKSDGVRGSMEFTHKPRYYFNFTGDDDYS
jgi:hypothetical protein